MASKKAAAKRGKTAQRGSSNVFSMFEQSQIQEFKENEKRFPGEFQSLVEQLKQTINYRHPPKDLRDKVVDRHKSGDGYERNSMPRSTLKSIIKKWKAFGCIDQNRDGIINKSDLKETYAQLGKLNVSDEELESMLAEGKGPINFTVFLTLFGEKLSGTDPEETILAAFKLFDPNATGVVNKDEFRRLLMNQADKFTAEEVDQAFAVAPIDVAGNIDYKSLCYIITHGDEKEES